VKQKPLRPTDFTPHSDDAASVAALAEIRTRFRLTPRGRVWSVFTTNAFTDSHVRFLLALPELIEFNRLQFTNQESRFTDDGFAQLGNHPKIQAFMDQNNPLLTDESARLVGTSNQLRWVNFPNCSITDAGVTAISNSKQLLALSLIANPITDNCIPDLCKLTNLRRLSVRDTAITDASITTLESNLPRCQVNPKWKPKT
jgi:hypothetical protein